MVSGMATISPNAPGAVALTVPTLAVEPWLLETILMVIMTVLSVAAFAVGYHVG